MASYHLLIEGTEREPRPGWTVDSTANGRDVLQCVVESANGSYKPALDDDAILECRVAIASSSAANPSTVTTEEPHGLVSGQKVTGRDHSNANLNADLTVTVVTPTTFTVPVLGGGTGGTVARRIFAGNIAEPEYQDLGDSGGIATFVHAPDYNAIAERHYMDGSLVGGTLAAQLQVLADLMADDGVTLHPNQAAGPSMDLLESEYVQVREVLDNRSVIATWPWEIDNWLRLYMWEPAGTGSPVAPFDVTDTNGYALKGTVSVKPTRKNYANKAVVRYSNIATFAYCFLTVTANFSPDDTVEIGGKTYTYKTSVTGGNNVDGYVLIGATAALSITYLAAAVRRVGGAGSTYADATTEHGSVTAYEHPSDPSGQRIAIRAKSAGAAGNDIGVTSDNGLVHWEGNTPCSTLLGGADQELVNVAIAQDAGEIAAHGVWTVVIEAPLVTSLAEAQALADAFLAARLQVPDVVTYTTTQLGARPGQTQTVTLSKFGLNGTYLITDVTTRHVEKNVVESDVTAVESLTVQAADRYRDKYRQWDGKVSGSAGAQVGTVNITQITGGGGKVFPLGGTLATTRSDATPTWIDATGQHVKVDTAVDGDTAVVTVMLWALDAGVGVTARLYEVGVGALSPTSSLITSTTPTMAQFTVTLTAGSHDYKLQMLPSAANKRVGAMGYMEVAAA